MIGYVTNELVNIYKGETTMSYQGPVLNESVDMLVSAAYPKHETRNLQMPGDPHYQPEALRPYLGYDQRVAWQIIVEWFWLFAQAISGTMPRSVAVLLTANRLENLLARITTTMVLELERSKTKHDILALLELMRKYLPRKLHPYLHLGLTSYDVICTAYALQHRFVYQSVIYPKACQVDELWRGHIREYANTLQIGRTHLQDALPITVGFWLAERHNRFVQTVRMAADLVRKLPGKFTGAVGTEAAASALSERDLQTEALVHLGLLPTAPITTQIVASEPTERFFHELKLISGTLAQLGEDVRHLQSSAVGEVTSASSTSSTMSHKGANPIAAENLAGMHRSVIGEFVKIMLNQQSDLGRDLRDSNVMRSYAGVMVFVYQQLLTAERMLEKFGIDEERCKENFWRVGKLVTAELLHLSLQLAGFPDAHTFVNKTLVPLARQSGNDLVQEMDNYVSRCGNAKLSRAWCKVPAQTKDGIRNPDKYLGHAVQMAEDEAKNILP